MSLRAKLIAFAVIAAWTLVFVWLMLFYEFSDVAEPDDRGAVLAGYIERGFFGLIWLGGIAAVLVFIRAFRSGQRSRSN